jgi:hypothetical protein
MHLSKKALVALLGVPLLLITACSSSSSSSSSGTTNTSASGSCGYTFAVITHGDNGSFWSVVYKGAKDAASALGCKLSEVYGSQQQGQAEPDDNAENAQIQDAINAHVNGIAVSDHDPALMNATIAKAVAAGIPVVMLNAGCDPADLAAMTEGDRARNAARDEWQQRSGAYMQIQGTRPQTIAHALTDSPAGLLAWIVEKFQDWTDPAAKLPEDAVDRDKILTDVSIYWFTGTAGSAAHTYYERFNDPAMWVPRDRGTVPTGVAVFTTDVTVRRFADKIHNVVRWSEFDRGGHFAALEAPDLLGADVRDFFRALD